MNGAHDMGGMHGFGAVEDEPVAPVFHGDWERKAFALTLACGGLGQWSIDESRYARERQPPARYLRNSYYEHWLEGLETLLVEKRLVTAQELASGKAEGPGTRPALPAGRVFKALQQGSPYSREIDAPARFHPGERVRVGTFHPVGHTRAPRYLRNHIGTITRHHGAHVFADSSAAGDRETAHHLYNVAFTSAELWGPHGQGGSVHADLWEPYLQAV